MRKISLCVVAVAGLATVMTGSALGQVDPGELAAFEAMRPDPGRYSNDVELISFDAPGLDANMRGMISQAMASGFAQQSSYCLKPEDTGEDWLETMSKSDCTIDSFDISGNSFSTAMTCVVEQGQTASIAMSGTSSGNSSDVTMSMQTNIPEMGSMTMTMRMRSSRIGDC